MNALAKPVLLAASIALMACVEKPRSQPLGATLEQETVVTETQDRESSDPRLAEGASGQTDGVANLPFARGETFRSLDAYLAHLEAGGAVGLPWWRETRPGVYQQVTTLRGKAPEIATRADLMRRFGFER